MSALLSTAAKLTEEVASARSGRALNKAVGAFSDLLETVPDHGAGAFTTNDINAIRAMADRVIDCIEDRIDAWEDRRLAQQLLAEHIYRIRRQLENVDLWRRHFSV